MAADLLLLSISRPVLTITTLIFCTFISFTTLAAAVADTTAAALPAINTGDVHDDHPTPYLISSSTFFHDYTKMLTTLQIYPYRLKTPPSQVNHTSQTHSLFHSSLILFSSLHNGFLTQNPEQAHLFYLPFPPDLSHRQLSDEINSIRTSLPYWNRSLAADHFFLVPSCGGVSPSAYRNTVELRKNGIQLTCCSSLVGNFIPHKDVSLPPHSPLPFPMIKPSDDYDYEDLIDFQKPRQRIGYFKHWGNSNGANHVDLLIGLEGDPDFIIETPHHNHLPPPTTDNADNQYVSMLKTSQFCLFIYEGKELIGLAEAMVHGCVPVVISIDGRSIQDMPLMSVLKWQELAVFVGSSVGSDGLKRMLREMVDGDEKNRKYDRMRELCKMAAKHLVWNYPPQPYDAFHMVLYQLWIRRHVVRYSTWERE